MTFKEMTETVAKYGDKKLDDEYGIVYSFKSVPNYKFTIYHTIDDQLIYTVCSLATYLYYKPLQGTAYSSDRCRIEATLITSSKQDMLERPMMTGYYNIIIRHGYNRIHGHSRDNSILMIEEGLQ